jgi:hypothetical protein
MTPNSNNNAVLDACILYPAPIRDLLLNLAEVGLFKPFWSDKIQEEWVRNLLINRPDLSSIKLHLTIEAMDSAFPDANIPEDNVLIKKLYLPDKNDQHVLATAIQSNSKWLVTANLKDFPIDNLKEYGVEAISADNFIASLFSKETDLAYSAFRNQLNRLQNPILNKSQILEIFLKLELHKTHSHILKHPK